MQKIIVRGARVHNLKNIDVEIPRNGDGLPLISEEESGLESPTHNISMFDNNI